MESPPDVVTSQGSGDAVVVRVPTQESELRAIRKATRAFVTSRGGGDDVADDVELAVSELATNVMQHSSADSVTVAMLRVGNGWQIDVHDADEVPPLDDVEPPPTESITGRGLFIVQSIMDEVLIVQTGDSTVIRCVKFDT